MVEHGYTVIGLDWATEESNRGFAVASVSSCGEVLDLLTQRCSRKATALSLTVRAIQSTTRPVVVAIDAPLGWPVTLSNVLAGHTAGAPISEAASRMFSRETDRFVRAEIGKIPLEVGANLIARVALSAVNFLGELRAAASLGIPLAWGIEDVNAERAVALEVYPAATARQWLMPAPESVLGVSPVVTEQQNPHTRDAMWCVVAGVDFLSDNCYPPTDLEIAAREGWIWFRRSALSSTE